MDFTFISAFKIPSVHVIMLSHLKHSNWKMLQISVLLYFILFMVKLDNEHEAALVCLLVLSCKITFLIQKPFSYHKANLEQVQCVFNLSLIDMHYLLSYSMTHHVLTIGNLSCNALLSFCHNLPKAQRVAVNENVEVKVWVCLIVI